MTFSRRRGFTSGTLVSEDVDAVDGGNGFFIDVALDFIDGVLIEAEGLDMDAAAGFDADTVEGLGVDGITPGFTGGGFILSGIFAVSEDDACLLFALLPLLFCFTFLSLLFSVSFSFTSSSISLRLSQSLFFFSFFLFTKFATMTRHFLQQVQQSTGRELCVHKNVFDCFWINQLLLNPLEILLLLVCHYH